MIDRELLELAAKAAVIEIENNSENVFAIWDFTQEPATFREWNPLIDDGDALRLAVKLHLPPEGIIMFHASEMPEWGSDPYAATRRAIVLAAAEIGKEMK